MNDQDNGTTHAYHPNEDVDETMCGRDPRDVGVSADMLHVDCTECLAIREKMPR